MDIMGTIDPFVRFNLDLCHLTVCNSAIQTSVKRNALLSAVSWNETFILMMEEPEPFALDLMDWDRTVTEKVGEVNVSMEDLVHLKLAKHGSEVVLSLPVVKDSVPVHGEDKQACTLKLKLRVVEDEQGSRKSPPSHQVHLVYRFGVL